MYRAALAGTEKPDFSAMQQMPPQFIGMLRAQLTQFQQMKAEQASIHCRTHWRSACAVQGLEAPEAIEQVLFIAWVIIAFND